MYNLGDYQVDHLLLLIGGNPLPNAVAGTLLVATGGQVTLLHTGDTAPIATKLDFIHLAKTEKQGKLVTSPTTRGHHAHPAR